MPVWISLSTGTTSNTVNAMISLLQRYNWSNTYLVWDKASNPLHRAFSQALYLSLRKINGLQTLLREMNFSKDTDEDRRLVLAEFRSMSRGQFNIMLWQNSSKYQKS